MKPSDLLKKMVLKKRAEQPNGTIDDSLHLELEKQVSMARSSQKMILTMDVSGFRD